MTSIEMIYTYTECDAGWGNKFLIYNMLEWRIQVEVYILEYSPTNKFSLDRKPWGQEMRSVEKLLICKYLQDMLLETAAATLQVNQSKKTPSGSQAALLYKATVAVRFESWCEGEGHVSVDQMCYVPVNAVFF